MTLVQNMPSGTQGIQGAFEKYAERCERTMQVVFHVSGSRIVDMRSWLFESAPTDAAKLDTMHTEPLVIVAEFLGVDSADAPFEAKQKKYRKLSIKEGWRRQD